MHGGSCSMSYNWSDIQKFYDDGNSFRDIIKHFGCAMQTIANAVKSGDLKTRTKSEAQQLRPKRFGSFKHTQETKDKISKIRKDFLTLNPSKVPYRLNHSSRPSYPELLMKWWLDKEGLTCEFKKAMGIYEYDFAFNDIKLDLEVDGSTHMLEKVKEIDKRRDEWSNSQGWSVLRIPVKELKNNPEGVIQIIKNKIQDLTKKKLV
jgi:very-short-patch-repair endonuclease